MKNSIETIIISTLVFIVLFSVWMNIGPRETKKEIANCVDIVAEISGDFDPALNSISKYDTWWYEDWCKDYYGGDVPNHTDTAGQSMLDYMSKFNI